MLDNSPIDTTRRNAARIAGVGYLALFVLAIFANFFVIEGLVDPASAETTVQNVQANEGIFRLGLAAFVVVFLIDIAVAWALYVLFAPAGRARSLLVAWCRLIYTVFLGVGVVFMFLGLQIANGTSPLGPEAALLMFQAFTFTWLVGLFAFGGHLILLGTLMIRSGLAPRLLGSILIVAGAAYAIDTLAHILVADYAAIAGIMLTVVAVPSVVAELAFTIWLLLAGRRSSEATRHEVVVPA